LVIVVLAETECIYNEADGAIYNETECNTNFFFKCVNSIVICNFCEHQFVAVHGVGYHVDEKFSKDSNSARSRVGQHREAGIMSSIDRHIIKYRHEM
jgi:hypothetical protein